MGLGTLGVDRYELRSQPKAQARRRAAFPGRSPPADADRPVAVRAVVQPGGSAGAKLVVEHDGATGGVVRDVRAHRLALGGSARCTQRGRVVEVGLEHAEYGDSPSAAATSKL